MIEEMMGGAKESGNMDEEAMHKCVYNAVTSALNDFFGKAVTDSSVEDDMGGEEPVEPEGETDDSPGETGDGKPEKKAVMVTVKSGSMEDLLKSRVNSKMRGYK